MKPSTLICWISWRCSLDTLVATIQKMAKFCWGGSIDMWKADGCTATCDGWRYSARSAGITGTCMRRLALSCVVPRGQSTWKHTCMQHINYTLEVLLLVRANLSFPLMIWKSLFTTSSQDHGTLGYLYSLLGRLPQAKKPKKDYNACSDALFAVVKGHFIAAASVELGTRNPHEESSSPAALKTASPAEKQKYVFHLAEKVLSKCTPI